MQIHTTVEMLFKTSLHFAVVALTLEQATLQAENAGTAFTESPSCSNTFLDPVGRLDQQLWHQIIILHCKFYIINHNYCSQSPYLERLFGKSLPLEPRSSKKIRT